MRKIDTTQRQKLRINDTRTHGAITSLIRRPAGQSPATPRQTPWRPKPISVKMQPGCLNQDDAASSDWRYGEMKEAATCSATLLRLRKSWPTGYTEPHGHRVGVVDDGRACGVLSLSHSALPPGACVHRQQARRWRYLGRRSECSVVIAAPGQRSAPSARRHSLAQNGVGYRLSE